MRLTATLEQAEDGTWTAAVFGVEDIILGTGPTREEALSNLRDGVTGLVDCLKSEGKQLPQSSVELVSIDVAA
ncbi:MAG TPA: type II toxin-antitoxin system HicB family antitoxin [Acidobacteriaceae bacterium]|nr:type II toxin-antitoxin system HicB family antitoxin [Acidobacteriaceae bacterium]